MIFRFAVAGVMLAAAGCATQTPEQRAARAEARAYAPADASAEQPDCFNARFINGYSEVDRDTVRVQVGLHDYYDIHVTGTCQDLDWNNRIGVSTRGSSNLCVGRGFGQGEVITREDRCTITDIAHSPRRPAEEEKPTDTAELQVRE